MSASPLVRVPSHSLFRWNTAAVVQTGKDFDPSQNHLSSDVSGLSAVFKPKSIAVIGATERKGAVGRTLVLNLVAANVERNIEVFPVNPTRPTICGLSAFKSVMDIPKPVDVAVVVTPARTVRDVVEDCGKKEVQAVVVISAGFKELGDEGLKLENEVVGVARKYGIRLVGPNCLGVMNPNIGLNATFAATSALKGNIAFMSQSGAMCTAVLDWSIKQQIGFSAFVSIGSMADVNWGDLIDYLGNDPQTTSILIYMETIGSAAHFLSAAKCVAMNKPIIVIKAGQTEEAAAAAASHTGSLAGSHDAFLAAMRRVGVLVVDTIGELFNCALVLGKQPRPQGPRLMIITNAGGPGVLATDATAMGGAVVAKLEEKTLAALNEFLPDAWSHGNPVDVLGDASPALYARTLDVCMKDGQSDGILIVLSPQAMTAPTETAHAVISAFQKLKDEGRRSKPILCSWMGGSKVQEGIEALNLHGIPNVEYPDAAAHTFAQIWKQTRDLQLMYEVPGVSVDAYTPVDKREKAVCILKSSRDSGRDLLTEAESKELLKAFDIPIAETIICESEDAAVLASQRVHYPCVVKLHSNTITHKSDVGGVKLNIHNEEGVREAWKSIKVNVDKIGPEHFQGVTVQPMIQIEKGVELILGSVVDAQFGPLVLFGSGGCYVEIFKDSALGIPPLNATLAARQMEDTKIFKALKGGMGQRFPGVDLKAVNRTLVRFSQMICDLSAYVAECDINPLLALPDRVVALDARIVLKKPEDPAPALAIRPYPREYIFETTMKNGREVTVRPIHANDFEIFVKFHETLSADSVRRRYLEDVSLESRLAQQYIMSSTCADYARLLALVVIGKTGEGEEEMLGIMRIIRWPRCPEIAELKLAVRDDAKGQGLGRFMLRKALEIGQKEQLKQFQSLVLEDSKDMLSLLKEFNFTMNPSTMKPSLIEVSYKL